MKKTAVAHADIQLMALGGIGKAGTAPKANAPSPSSRFPPGPDVADLHNRMPLVLEERDWRACLGEAEGDPSALLQVSPLATVRAWPFASTVNGADLLESV